MQVSEDMFPIDWSPPPVDFLNPETLQAGQWTSKPAHVGKAELHQQQKELKQKPVDLDPKDALTSLKARSWNMLGPSQQAASPGGPSDWYSFTSRSSDSYVNSLDYLLQEKREQNLKQEWEELVLQDCPNLISLNLGKDEEVLTPEHRMLVEKYSVSQQVIPQVHPGEQVFQPHLTHHQLLCVLESSQLKPRSHLEEMFLSSSPFQQLSFLHKGLLSNLYLHTPNCPVPLLRWLFQLLAWPPETSSEAFGLLWDLSTDRLFSPPGEEDTGMWCPTLQELTEVFHHLGARSPVLNCKGPFQAGEREPESEASFSWTEQQTNPQELSLDLSISYICKFLTLCVLAQPEIYTDDSLLDLIELLCQANLDVGLRLLPKTDLQQLLLLLLDNIREWPGKLRQLCCTLSRVSDHHHNLVTLVQFFLDVTARSRQLRSQLSLLIIAQMLGQQETVLLWQEKNQLSSLCRLLSLMKLSSLQQYLSSSSKNLPLCENQQPKASTELDHKACYLCHSLLMLARVVVSCQDITPDQWGELQLLCVQLDRHISTQIRESPQAMHRTTLKDLATQIYISWQELLTSLRWCPRKPQAWDGREVDQYFYPLKAEQKRAQSSWFMQELSPA
ncbi:protein FAM178B [Rhynchocyon petersi]